MAEEMSGFLEEELDKIDTEVLIRYALADHLTAAAIAVVNRFSTHKAATRVLRHYYRDVPEGREEMVEDLRIVAQHQGLYLFAVKATHHNYLYVGSGDDTMLVGEYEQGLADHEILNHFGYRSGDEFLTSLPKRVADLTSLPDPDTAQITCVACGVMVGELHLFGCPVELCPWCGGQLSQCNCRFDQLGVDVIEDEQTLDRLEIILNRVGRIAFSPEQNPSYPAFDQ
ncbi:MAG: hypothetical protein N839_0013580 [Desulfofustis sp. PB-SRB1]|jgi:hypothetical protein|nr:hypothetical protein [Desulfofustis sp. PB-SRB1]MBM1003429.1 hypothetical protein [Desulfofustis sp. PB-SRB1]